MKKAIEAFQKARENMTKSMFGIAGITIEIFEAASEAEKAINRLHNLLVVYENSVKCEICGKRKDRLWTVDGKLTCDSCMDDREREMEGSVDEV